MSSVKHRLITKFNIILLALVGLTVGGMMSLSSDANASHVHHHKRIARQAKRSRRTRKSAKRARLARARRKARGRIRGRKSRKTRRKAAKTVKIGRKTVRVEIRHTDNDPVAIGPKGSRKAAEDDD